MSEFQIYEALPRRVRSVQFHGDYTDLPAEARASTFIELNEFGWVVVHTPDGPRRLYEDYYLTIGTAGEWYPIAPAVHEYKYRPVDGEEQS